MSPPTPKKSPGDTRQQIISAALSLFTTKGYFNTSVHDIASESKVSIGSIYHHFKDKEGVASALYSEMMGRMTDELTQIKDQHNSAHERCRAVVELLFQIAEEQPELMEFMLYSKHREFLPSERPICSSRPFDIMRSFVSYGMEQGEILEMELMVASTCLFGGPIRMITSSLDGILENPLSSYLDEVWRCSWRAVAR